jgi:ribonuclease HI
MSYYAVANGRKIGIFLNWAECNNSINGYENAKFKKFYNNEDAEKYIQSYTGSIIVKKQEEFNTSNNNIFSDIFAVIDKTKTDTLEEKNDTEFIPDYYVYTDGACSNNGKDNALAGIGIYFGSNDTRNLSKIVKGKQSNNTAELGAIVELYKIIEKDIIEGKKIAIVTDSQYVILCLTTYGDKCNKRKWEKDIPNKELVKMAYLLYNGKSNIKFIHINAHTNNLDIHSIGNENADKLANLAIGLDNCPYNEKLKIYLNVPYIKKDQLKKLGGLWDVDNKKWYINDDNKNKDEILSIFEKE